MQFSRKLCILFELIPFFFVTCFVLSIYIYCSGTIDTKIKLKSEKFFTESNASVCMKHILFYESQKNIKKFVLYLLPAVT